MRLPTRPTWQGMTEASGTVTALLVIIQWSGSVPSLGWTVVAGVATAACYVMSRLREGWDGVRAARREGIGRLADAMEFSDEEVNDA